MLNLSPAAGGMQIDWYSDTDRLLVEQTSGLDPSSSWSPTTNSPTISARHRFLTLPVTGSQNYFRLRSQ